jgi:AmmeMemoRadiSam system protein A
MLPTNAGANLLPIARSSIANALGRNQTAPAEALWLHSLAACFVTLTQNGQLRGCIGSLQARRSLLIDVKANAVAAALHDPRFAQLTDQELDRTEVEVSVLSPSEPLAFTSEAHALSQLRPGIDGIVFEYAQYRSTFLPQVWEQLPQAQSFLSQLKRKAGLSGSFWAEEIKLHRYTVQKWSESAIAWAPDNAGDA